MAEGQNNIQLGNTGNIDWNKLKPGLKKENIAKEFNTIWDKIDTTKDGEIDQAEIDAFKNDLAQAIEDEVITCEEAKAFLESKGINNVEEENLFQFMLQLGNSVVAEDSAKPKASDFGFVDGKLENIEIDTRAAGIAKEVYTGSVRIPEGQSMPEDGSLPTVLLMDLPDSFGENATSKLTYNEADGTYMSRMKDMAFRLEQDENGNVVFRAVDDEQLKLKRESNLKQLREILGTKGKIGEIKTADILDNYYGESYQIGQGDCYLMAAINAIRNLHDGQKILQNLRTEEIVDGKKVYTITLPGAKLAAIGLKNDKLTNGIFITGEYKFTEEDIKNILDKAGERYSSGDLDVMLLEAAFERYREEIAQTLDANGISRQNDWRKAGMFVGKHEDNILRSGYTTNAVFVLTGKTSEFYSNSSGNVPSLSKEELRNNKASLYVPIQPDLKDFAKNNNTSKNDENKSTGKTITSHSISEIQGPIKRSSEDLGRMLYELELDYSLDQKIDKIATATFKLASDESEGYHAFTIKQVTPSQVVLINPWYPDKDLVMPREMFNEYVINLTVHVDNSAIDWMQVVLAAAETMLGNK